MKNLIYAVPFGLAGILLAVVSIMSSACYTLKQGAVMLGYLNSAAPLESLLNDTPPLQKDVSFVSEIKDIRRFAVQELGLKETKNYITYVSIDRKYLAAVVSACAKDSFTNYEWWFPVVGRMPYKGFFNAEDAKKEAEKLRNKDLDTLIRPVDAFSSLGWFNDPLYSFMKDYSAARLADLIIHESSHATLFLKNQVQFNEEFAEFVGTEGARLYIQKKFGAESEEYKTLLHNERESKIFVAYLKNLTDELDQMYKSAATREEKLDRKERIIAAAQEKFTREYDSMFTRDTYKFFSTMKVNNAYLSLYQLYHEGGSRLHDVYTASGGDLHKFIAAAKTLNNKSPPFEQLKQALME